MLETQWRRSVTAKTHLEEETSLGPSRPPDAAATFSPARVPVPATLRQGRKTQNIRLVISFIVDLGRWKERLDFVEA